MNGISGNPSYIRNMNRANVLNIIRQNGPITQTQIAKALALQPSTILRIVHDLVDEERIKEIGKNEAGSKGGRRASMLDLDEKGAYAVGVDLGSEEIIAVLINLKSEVIAEVRKDLPFEEGAPSVLKVAKEVIVELLTLQLVPKERVVGIGVSMPGKVDSQLGISVYAINFKNWNNVPIREELEKAFDLPVYLEHDIRSMAFGEMWKGEECKNIICLGFRRGIGLATIINGELYRGSNEFAGDVGHISVEPNGPLCSCGKKGCLEALTSEEAFIYKYGEMINRPSEEITIPFIFQAMNNGESLALELIKDKSRYMGKVLSDLARVFDPERIIIGGNCIASSEQFLAFVRSSFQMNQPNYADPNITIESTYLGENGCAVGAAFVVLSHLFKVTE
ncbi:ROK family protein [Alkalihalobacillus sp. 1P02AB]|uniref:ROK family transcriptional regulator n=1 Tax=Alkalihalobacillus sp. 1P02AB TaxID=3132260 RepID=UPI0039A74C76